MQLSAASPMPMQRAPSSRLASGMLETFSSLNSEEQGEMNLDTELAEDEEFATEEHAHRFLHTLDNPDFKHQLHLGGRGQGHSWCGNTASFSS